MKTPKSHTRHCIEFIHHDKLFVTLDYLDGMTVTKEKQHHSLKQLSYPYGIFKYTNRVENSSITIWCDRKDTSYTASTAYDTKTQIPFASDAYVVFTWLGKLLYKLDAGFRITDSSNEHTLSIVSPSSYTLVIEQERYNTQNFETQQTSLVDVLRRKLSTFFI